ncbi:hypothetical protein BGZ74_003296, partial [Mortierella antarctica]
MPFGTAALRQEHFEEAHCDFYCTIGDCTKGFETLAYLLVHKLKFHKVNAHEDILHELARLPKGVRAMEQESKMVEFPAGSYLSDGVVMNNGQPASPWRWADKSPLTVAQKNTWPLLQKHGFVIKNQVKVRSAICLKNGDMHFDYLRGKTCSNCGLPLTDDTGVFELTRGTLHPLCLRGECMVCRDKRSLESSWTPERWMVRWAQGRVRDGHFKSKEAALVLIYNVAIHGWACRSSTVQGLNLHDLKAKALAAVIHCYWCGSRIDIGGDRDPQKLFVVDRTVFEAGPWTPTRGALSYADPCQKCVASCSRCNQFYMNRTPTEHHEMMQGIRATFARAKVEGPEKINEMLEAYDIYIYFNGITDIEQDMTKPTSTAKMELPTKRTMNRIDNTSTVFSISESKRPKKPCPSSPNNKGSTTQILNNAGSDLQESGPAATPALSTTKSIPDNNSLDEEKARSKWSAMFRLAQERLRAVGITMADMEQKWTLFMRNRLGNEANIGWNYEAFVIYYGINGGRCIITGRPIRKQEAQTDRVFNNCRYTLGSVMFLSAGSNMAKRLDPRFQHSSSAKGKEYMSYGLDILQQDIQHMLDQAEGVSQ